MVSGRSDLSMAAANEAIDRGGVGGKKGGEGRRRGTGKGGKW